MKKKKMLYSTGVKRLSILGLVDCVQRDAWTKEISQFGTANGQPHDEQAAFIEFLRTHLVDFDSVYSHQVSTAGRGGQHANDGANVEAGELKDLPGRRTVQQVRPITMTSLESAPFVPPGYNVSIP
jgi:hypothetical protein